MSSHKKRRIEGVEEKGMSAIEALKARQRGAATSPTQKTQPTSESEEQPVMSSANRFNLLRKDSSQNAAPKSPRKSAAKDPRLQRGVESPASRSRGTAVAGGNTEPTKLELAGAFHEVKPYSTFRLSKQNHKVKIGGVVEITLPNKERFVVIGSYGIRVIRGEVKLAGATLYPSDTIEWVHAPYCYAVPVLRTAEETKLEFYPDNTARGIRQLGRLSPLFRKMWVAPPEIISAKVTEESTFELIYTHEEASKRSIEDMVPMPAWNKKLSSLVATSRKKASLSTLICGPKSAGKSTFLRLFLNGLLTDRPQAQNSRKVVVLDLDPGQPEYAPAGTVSLVSVNKPNIGTPFTHTSSENSAFKVVRCHSMASVTPASNPDLYLSSAADLFDTYSKHHAGDPLIINTPGWIQGTGLDLLCTLIERIKPHEVLFMSEVGSFDSVDALRAATELAFTELPSQPSKIALRTAAHLRAMQTMSYFHLQDMKPTVANASDTPSRLKWNASPLSFRPPLLVQYSSLNRGVLGLLSYDYQCPPELLADTVNGQIMAAVEIEDARAFSNFTQEETLTEANDSAQVNVDSGNQTWPLVTTSPEGIPLIPNYNDAALDPRYSRTIGLVLLRGIDMKSKTLQLVTPIPLEDFRQIKSKGRSIVLLHGKFDTPSWAYTEELYERAGVDEGNEMMLEAIADMEDNQSEAESEDGDGTGNLEDEDTGYNQPGAKPDMTDRVSDLTEVPWVEVLKGGQRRPIGSRVLRVRRDLGRNKTGD
ncbi:hypothetical protein LB507_000053 [Fusarium sp. FIESC RH6]|nr:hypothetical protein LB507_000053 [Fusarium sp. FIESC RH6]